MGQSYRDLEVWQKAMNLVVECYRSTEQFPKSEMYGLTSQLRRAAVSIPANIAEGQGRQHLGEFIQFLAIANGSLTELETHIQIAQRLEYLENNVAKQLLLQTDEVARMLKGLSKSLKSKG